MLSLTVPAVRTDKFEVNREAVVSPVRWPLKSLIIHYELLHRSPLLSTTYLLLIYDRSLYTFSYMKLFLTLHTSFSDPKRHILNTHTLVLLRDADWNVFNLSAKSRVYISFQVTQQLFSMSFIDTENLWVPLSLFFLPFPFLHFVGTQTSESSSLSRWDIWFYSICCVLKGNPFFCMICVMSRLSVIQWKPRCGMSCMLFLNRYCVCKLVGNVALYIPMEGLQHSPEDATEDKKPAQRMCVWVPLSFRSPPRGRCLKGHTDFIFWSVILCSKHHWSSSISFLTLTLESFYLMRHWARHLSPSTIHILCFLFLLSLSLYLHHLFNSISKQSFSVHAFILTFHCAPFLKSVRPSSLLPLSRLLTFPYFHIWKNYA